MHAVPPASPAPAALAAPPDQPASTDGRAKRGPAAIAPPAGYLTEARAAGMLGVLVTTLRKWAVYRRGPARTKVGKRVLYREEAVRAWLATQERDPAAARKGR